MKFLKKSIYALSLVSLLGLWSCSQEEMLQDGVQTPGGKTVQLTLTVNRGDAQTRTIVSENDEAGLNSVWKKEDVIGLYNSEGNRVGELTLKKGEEGKSSSVFEGTFTGDSGTYNLWYFGQPGENGNYPHIDFNTNTKMPRLTLPTSPMTEPGQLAEFDILSKAAEIVVSNDKAAVKEDVIMDPRMAMAKFTFKGLPEKKTGKLTISNNDATNTTLYTAGNIKLTDHEIGVVANAYEDYVIENVSTDKDLYIALLPDVQYKLGFKFEVGNTVYTHEFKNPTKLEAGLYYNGGMNTEGNKVNGYELSFTEIVDHSKNPLAKWAEANLDNGKLYQWGRNHGYTDYRDATGSLTTQGKYGYYYWGYAALTNNAYYGVDLHAGTGIHIINGNFIQDSFLVPETAQDIKDNPNMYIMNARFNDTSGDYWIFANGGNDWYSRAKACGYSQTNPSPEGWKLPTESDFKEIMPDKTFSGNESLSNLINGYSEMKETSEGYKYVIRWLNNGSEIVIQALMVKKSFEESQLSTVNWNDTHVEERVFPYTGKIVGYNASKYVLGGYEYMARPMPLGVYTTDTQKVGNYYESATIATLSVAIDVSDSFGGYWMSDSKKAFKFVDNEKYKNEVNGQTSYFGIDFVNAHDGLAIRCVKAN